MLCHSKSSAKNKMESSIPYRQILSERENPSVEIIQAVASITGAGKGELSPLYSVVDTDALNRLSRTGGDYTISFEYEGFHVTADSNKILLRDPDSIHTELTDVSNVLLIAPDEDSEESCTDLLQPYPPAHQNVLNVLVDGTVNEKLNSAYSQTHDRPNKQRIISLGEITRSAKSQSVQVFGTVTADLIADTTDLASLTERIHTTVSDWESTQETTVVCFDSIGAMVNQHGLDTAYSFLYNILPKLAESGCISHFHLDPMTCDQSVKEVVPPLFDAVVYEDLDCSIMV